MYEENQDPISSLIHLYIDGAFSRRELIRRVAKYTGSIIAVHENRGLVDHIKDVARRIARAGFVGLAPDLLSRQGGTKLFTDPTAQAQAYGRTLPQERLADLFSSMTFLKLQPTVQWQKLGAVGFCAGGGNCWNLALGAADLGAAVIYYGTPVPPVDQLDSL